jgi:hypothetical protein
VPATETLDPTLIARQYPYGSSKDDPELTR